MRPEILGVMIPIIFLLVGGLVAVTAIYLRSRERQMLFEKGLSADQIKEFFQTKKDAKMESYGLLQFGIICVFFGLGLGIGLMLEDYTSKDYWTVLFIFTFTGGGFILANLIARKLANSKK
jgi:hypothetical protein